MHIHSLGSQGRIIMARVLPDSDLVQAIKEIAEENNINSGYITTCIGSLKQASFVYPVSKSNTYFNMVYSDNVALEGPIELLGCQGVFGKDEKGNFQIHLHGVLSDEKMTVYGGHILDEGNIVLVTIDLVLQEVVGINLKRNYDAKSGFSFFIPSSEREE